MGTHQPQHSLCCNSLSPNADHQFMWANSKSILPYNPDKQPALPSRRGTWFHSWLAALREAKAESEHPCNLFKLLDSIDPALASTGSNSSRSEEGGLGELVGRKVLKYFPSGGFEGVVTRYDEKPGFFHVVYEDGDSEDFTLDELQEVTMLFLSLNQLLWVLCLCKGTNQVASDAVVA